MNALVPAVLAMAATAATALATTVLTPTALAQAGHAAREAIRWESDRQVPGGDPLGVVRAYEAAWNAQDLDAVSALFAAEAQAPVLVPGGGYLIANQATVSAQNRPGYLLLAPLTAGPGRRVQIWWCPAQRTCRVAGGDYRGDGNTVTWRHLLYADSLPPALDPWEATAEVVVEGGKITLFRLVATPDWAARLRLVQDAQARDTTAQLAQAAQAAQVARAAAQAGAPGAAPAGATAGAAPAPARPDRGAPSPVRWAAAAVAMLVVAGLALVRRPPAGA